MINPRYIEITSAHRDRTRFPHPSQFNLDLSLSGQQTSFKDPVYDSVILFPPPNLDYPTVYPNFGYMYGINEYTVGILPIASLTSFQTNALYPNDSTLYIGDTLELVQHTSSGSVVATNEYRVIVDYEKTSLNVLNATISTVLTNKSITTNLTSTIPNFFVGWEVEVLSATNPAIVGEKRTITEYRAYDKCVFFDSPIYSLSSGDVIALNIPTYQVRINTPFSVGVLPNLSINNTILNNTTFRIRSGTSVPMTSGTFVGGTINTFTLPPSVGTFNYTNQLLSVTSNPVVYAGVLTSAGFTSSGGFQNKGTFVLDVGSSLYPNDYFNNMVITITSGSFVNNTYTIINWDKATRTGTIDLGWTSNIIGTTNPIAGDSYQIKQLSTKYYTITNYDPATRQGQVIPSFNYKTLADKTYLYNITSNDTFQILQYKTDNYSPLDYVESVVHQQQAHCYEITLVSLTLPNVPLKTGMGGKISEYPYVYVEFKSITQGTSAYNFNSNNPVVQKNIMFIAPLVYNFNPKEAKFITLDGHGMVQQLKFKPNDAFSFAVYLPNGDLFITQDDYFSPSEPNPFLQISACFGVKRIV